MKLAIFAFAVLAVFMVLIAALTQEPAQVPETATNVRTNWLGTSYDQVKP